MMPRFQTDDAFDSDPAVLRAGTAAMGLYYRCGIYVARHLLDGFVPTEIAAQYGTPEWAKRLTDAALWEPVQGSYNMPLYFAHGNLPRAQVLADRAKRTELRNPMILKAVRERDGDWCRYCGHKVNWNDRRGTYGATYDHVIPGLLGGADNLVVACRSCNSAKRDRTPEEAGMTLLNPRSRSRPRSDLGQTRTAPDSDLTPSPPLSGGKRAAARAPRGAGAAPHPLLAVAEQHEFTPDGNGDCEVCGLPEINQRHQAAS